MAIPLLSSAGERGVRLTTNARHACKCNVARRCGWCPCAAAPTTATVVEPQIVRKIGLGGCGESHVTTRQGRTPGPRRSPPGEAREALRAAPGSAIRAVRRPAHAVRIGRETP